MNASLLAVTGWTIGYTIGIIVVLVVVALVVPILMLAKQIGDGATAINNSLGEAVRNTAPLAELNTTIASAQAITAGLNRGRKKLGG
jgi:hypothetical protein